MKHVKLSQEQLFYLYTINRRWSNASLMRYRNFDGHIVSMQQSGTHWLKNMLAHIMTELYDLPPLEHIQDDSIIGHTKTPPKYKNIPQIIHSHGYPHALTLKLPVLHYPKYLVLLRDLRESLVSHYERFKGDYPGVGFSEYLKGDVRQKKFHSDIFTRIRFMNEWGDVIKRNPQQTLFLRYEDIKQNPSAEVFRICSFFNIKKVTEEHCARAVAATTKDKMAQKPNPDVKTTVVRLDHKPLEEYYTPSNQAIFEGLCRQMLSHDFGYGYPIKQQASGGLT